jgi:hypothetical protein
MAFKTYASQDEVEESVKAANSFAAIPQDTYEFTIVKVDEQGFPGKGANAGKPTLNVQLRRIEDDKPGAKRVFFKRIPLFGRWAPSAKYPDGYPALGDFIEFAVALGVPKEVAQKGELPLELHEILGKPITAYLKLNEPDQYNDGEWNEVGRLKASTHVATSSTSVSADVWNTPAPASDAPETPWGTSAPVAKELQPTF